MANKSRRTAKPFPYRKGWRIQVTLDNGTRPAENFKTHGECVDWANEQLANCNNEHAPALGGPKQATLALALDYYARNFSVGKEGVAQELVRINQYLEGASMALLKAVKNDNGALDVVSESECAVLSPEFQAYVDKRRASRKGTFDYKHRLANMKCSRISPDHIQGFFVQMQKDGLSDSTIQKEIALLKVFFNSAKRMNWKGLENPCEDIKLGKSQRRFVHLTEDQRNDLMMALHECDNPYFLPLVLTAKETTLRLDTLVSMTWKNTSVQDRNAYLPTKTGDRPYVLSKQVQAILGGLPQSPDGFVFPMSKSAIDSMWKRVRIKCNLPKLQFRDLRHLGATDWVRRGLNAHELKAVLGHSGLGTALFYVDLVGKDLEKALDEASEHAGVIVLPPEFPKDPQAHLNARRAARLNKQPLPQANPVAENQATPKLPPVLPEALPNVVTPESALVASMQASTMEAASTPAGGPALGVPASNVVSFDAFRRKAA